MNIDESKDAVPDSVSAGDRQNRREFLNGLGKWSMIVVGAVSFLRGTATRLHAGREETLRPEWESPGPTSRRLAKKPHVDVKHIELAPGAPGYKDHVEHGDYAPKTQPGGRQPSGEPPTKVQE
jgi:hypothetical protein